MAQFRFLAVACSFVYLACLTSVSQASIFTIDDSGDWISFNSGQFIIRGALEKYSVNDGNDFLRLKDSKKAEAPGQEWGYNTTSNSQWSGWDADITTGGQAYDTQYNDKDFINPRTDEALKVEDFALYKDTDGTFYRAFGLSVQDNGGSQNALHGLADFRFGVNDTMNGAITSWDSQVTGVTELIGSSYTTSAGGSGTFQASDAITLYGQINSGTNADILFLLRANLFSDNTDNLHIFAALEDSNAGPDRFFRVSIEDGGPGGDGNPVPEPGTIAIWSMIGLGAVGGAAWRRRKNSKAA